jgi:hypothetical protein
VLTHLVSFVRMCLVSQPVRLAGGWWLVLIYSERKVLLAGCWWLVHCERKVNRLSIS